MNFNRVLVISFFVLVISTYQTDSGIIFSLLLKVLLLKGALFMSMPLSIGAFMMGQGMGFFAGNMMGGYMMMRAANRYHNSEKYKWMSSYGPPSSVSPHTSYGPPSSSGHGHSGGGGGGWGWQPSKNPFAEAFVKGKHIGGTLAVLKHHKVKLATAAAKVKGYLGGLGASKALGIAHGFSKGWDKLTPGWGKGGHKGGGYTYYSKGPTHYKGPSKGWGGWSSGSGYGGGGGYQYASHTKSSPVTVLSSSSGYAPGVPSIYGTSDTLHSTGYAPPSPYGGSQYKSDGDIVASELIHTASYPATSEYEALGSSSHLVNDPSSNYYTSVYEGPGHEYTGIMTNNHQDSSYLTAAQDKSTEELYLESDLSGAASTVSPNPIIEKYLEKRLEEEASTQKDVEQKQEAQQLIQILRKAYLKQLVESLKEEENVVGTSTTTSTESSRGSRSIESKERYRNSNVMNLLLEQMKVMDMDVSPSDVEDVISNPTEELPTVLPPTVLSSIRPFVPMKLETDIFATSIETNSTTTASPELSSSDRVSRESGEEVTTRNSDPSTTSSPTTTSTTTTESYGPETEAASVVDLPAMWVKAENSFSGEGDPFVIRVRRQAGQEQTEEEYYEEDKTGTAGQERSPSADQQTEREASATPSPEVQNQVKSFVEDIKKFFTLLNVLDQDQCLQKLVCDVHTNQKDPSTITQYEQNILTTFRLMKALMPVGDEDSTTKYRRAALIGETGQSLELCQQTYASCGFSSSQIITLGTQGEGATASDWTGAGGTEQTAEASGRSEYVTLMPRVRRSLRSFYV